MIWWYEPAHRAPHFFQFWMCFLLRALFPNNLATLLPSLLLAYINDSRLNWIKTNQSGQVKYQNMIRNPHIQIWEPLISSDFFLMFDILCIALGADWANHSPWHEFFFQKKSKNEINVYFPMIPPYFQDRIAIIYIFLSNSSISGVT